MNVVAAPIACAVSSCTSQKEPVWAPVFLVFARPNSEPARARLHLRLCDDCRDRLALGDFLTDGSWANVTKRWPARFAHPDRTLTRLDWDLVELDEDVTEP